MKEGVCLMKLYIIIGTSTFVVATSEDEAVAVARYNGYNDNDIEIAIREDIRYEEEYGWCGHSTFKWDGWQWCYSYTRRSGCMEYRNKAFMLYD